MQAGLQQIKQVKNVYGCFLADNHGEVIAVDPPLELTGRELDLISLHVIQVLLGLETWGDAAEELDFIYQGSRLVVRDLGHSALIVICDSGLDISLLRMTVNVVTSRWEQDEKIRKELESHAVSRDVELPDIFVETNQPEDGDLFIP